MKRFSLLLAICLSVIQFLLIQHTIAEGTKQVEPTISDYCKLRMDKSNAYNNFALYSASPSERLYIHIGNLGEKIYFGLGGGYTGTINCRIKDQDGNIVWGPMALPKTAGSNGFIENWTQAFNGPNALSASGYLPLSYVPHTIGDFYIEFDYTSGSREFNQFDVTVIDTTITPLAAIPGRLYSKFWQFSSGNIASSPGYNGTMFVLADDSVVTSLYFNAMQGHAFEVSCNQNGCYAPPMSFDLARRSVNSKAGYAQYKIFLNNPDSLEFPSGVLGQIVPGSISVNSQCDGSFNVSFSVTKTGSAEVVIHVNPDPGIQPEDVVLNSTVTPGSNTFNWNGVNGLGVPVANGTQVNVVVSYINGLTNFPVFDVESHPNGFVMELVRPAGPAPITFWNDTLINGGTLNLTGCFSAPPTTGCHTWIGDYNGGLGNAHTVNTWWYATSASTTPIVVLRKSHENYHFSEEKCEGDTIIREGTTILTPGNYSFTFTSVITGCDSTRIYHVLDNPRPVVDLGADVWICEGLTHQFDGGAGVGYTYQWDNITTATNNIASTQTYTTGTEGFYRVTVNNTYNCPKSDSVNLFVNPKPNVTNDPMTDTICSHATFTLDLTSAIPSTTYSWIPTVTTGNITGASSGSGTQISHTLINTDPTNSILKYTLTPVSGGCYGNDTNYFVVVKPKPQVTTTPLTYTLCSPDTIDILLTSQIAAPSFGWVASASSANVIGFADGTGSTIHQGLTNTGYGIETVTYNVAASGDNCTGDTVTFTVTLKPRPDLTTSPLIHSQCNDQSTGITLTTNVTGTLFTWEASASSPNLSGQGNSVTPATAINQTINNSGYNIDTVFYTIVPQANGCTGDTSVYKVTVYPTPDLTNTPLSQSQCNNLNTNISLTSNITGTQFTWTCNPSSANITGWSDNATPATLLDQTLVNSGNNVETVTYTILPAANGCNGSPTDYTVTIFPTPNMSNVPPNGEICSGESTGIVLLSTVLGTTFTWTCSQPSGNVAGYVANPGPGTTLIDQTLTLTGYVTDSVLYVVTPRANGCDGQDTTFTQYVHPVPELTTNPMWDSICSETSTNIQITSTTASTTFSWTATLVSGDISGFTNGSGNQIIQTLTNNLNVSGLVTYTIIPATTSCTGLDTTYTVTVRPTPHLTIALLTDSVCNNTSPNITLTSDVAGTEFTWTCTPSSGNVTGWSDVSTPTTLLDQTLVNSGYNTESVIYHITPNANDCDGPVYDLEVTVFPTPDLTTSPLSQEQCNNQNTNIALTSNVANTLFTWTAIPSSPGITGYSDQLTGITLIDHTLVNSSYIDQTVTYHITPHANDCDGIVYDYIVTVHPTPDLTNTPLNQSQCNNLNTNIDLTSNVSGTQFTWTATGSSANVTGFSDNTTPSTLIGHTLVNSGFDIETVTYEITPHANNCDGSVYTYVVTLFPTPDLQFNPPLQTLCSGETSGIALSSSVLDSTFSWTVAASSATITGHSAGSGGSIVQTLSNSGTTIETATYTVTPSANGCDGIPLDVVVTVNPVTHVTNSPLSQNFCSGGTAILNLTADVLGTTYTWTATPSSGNLSGFSDGTGNIISQTLTNSGYTIDTVFYTITPTANGCDGPDSVFAVVVYPIPDVSNDPMFSELCNGTSTNISILSNVAGASFIWTASPSSANIIGWGPGSGTLIDQLLTNTGFAIENVTYHITPAANGCTGDVYDFVATVVSQPDVYFDPAAQTICDGESTYVQVLSHVTSATFTWTALASSPNLNGYADGSGPLINQAITNSGNTIETVTYTATPVAFGCPAGLPDNVVVTVNPTPHVSNNPLSQSICSEANTNFPFTATVAGTSFAWTATPSSPNLSGYSDDSGPSIIQTITNSGYTIETVTYQVTPAANGCDGPDSNVVVTVYPTPDLANDPKDTAICSGQPTGVNLLFNVTGTLFTWTASGSSANISGYSDNATPTTFLDQILTNSGYTIETVTYHVAPAANGCDGIVTDYTVTVYPVPNLSNSPASKAICNGDATGVTLLSNVANTLFTWTTTASSPNLGGFSDNGTPTVTMDQTLTNSGYTIETVTYHITPRANGCDGIVWDYTVTVFPTPDLSNNPPSMAICNGQSTGLPLLSNVANTLFTWTADASSLNLGGFTDNTIPTTTLNQTLTNSGYTIEWVTYQVTPTANGCDGTIWDYTVTVYPVPDVSNIPMNMAICNGQVTNLSLQSNVANTLFTWTAISSSPLVTGYSDNTGTPVNLIDQQLVNPTFTNQTVTYHITPHANGCDGIVWDYTVTIYPTANLSNSPVLQTQCNQQGTNISLTSNVANTTFTWRAFSNSPSTTGFSNNPGPGETTINQILRNDGFDVDTVTYRLMPNANACNGDSTDYRVIVFPTPDMSNDPPASQVCNSTPTGVTLISHVDGTTFTWSCTPSSGLITGWSNNSVPTTSLNQILVNNGLLIETVTYHMTPSANGCIGPDTNYIVTVVQSPDVYFNPPAETICSEATSNIQILSHVPGTTYDWTTSSSSPNLTGYSDGTGDLIVQSVTNSGTTIETVTYTVSPTAWGCPPGLPGSVVLTVNPEPVITNIDTTFAICSSTNTGIVPQSSVVNSSYTWVATGSSANVSGFSDGTGMVIVQQLVNTGFVDETVTYTIRPTANNCSGETRDFVVTVFPVADVYFDPNGEAICTGETCTINILSHVTGSTYTWTATGSSGAVSGYSGGSGELIQQTLFNSGYTLPFVTYQVTPAANGCAGTTSQVIVTVNPWPSVDYSICTDIITTTNGQSILLKGGIPLGGTYTGTGVNAGVFYPGIAGEGVYTIIYTYTNDMGCTRVDSNTITVVAPLPFNCGETLTDIRDGKVYPTVTLGSQCWMASNLNYGNVIASSQVQRDNCQFEKYCLSDNPANCTTYGGMYQWDEMMNYTADNGAQGFCPPGWHIPTETEWSILFNLFISNGFAGNALKTSGYSGFNGLTEGIRFHNSTWRFASTNPILHSTMIWSSTPRGSDKAWAHGMNEVVVDTDYTPSVSFYPSSRINAFSVRCIRD